MSATCPNCGKPVPPSALQGLCPECMLQLGAASQTEAPGEAGPHGTRVARPPPPKPEEIAKHFPQLEILECLGRGGMGVVYKARQPRLDRLVALKILAPEKEQDPKFAERFTREARALARLNHPNIVTVHDFGEADGFCYLMMEYVDGASLRQLLRGGKTTPEEALTIVPPICEALQYAHQQGIVHRDIKPENILLDKQGRVKIADFGIAKIVGSERKAEPLTGDQQVMGTPHYMAPEQVEKPATVDHRADIYSLGVVFYEMLTGELPLGKFQPPSKKVQVDVRLDEVVLHALEKEPNRRYQQASQVKSDVETIAGTPPPLSSEVTPAEMAQLRRHLLVKAACFSFAALCFLIATVSFASSDQALAAVLSVVATVFFGIAGYRHFSAVQRCNVAAAGGSGRTPDATRNVAPDVPLPPTTEPRLSRTAIWGAIWAPLFFIAAVPFFFVTSHEVRGSLLSPPSGPAWWQIALSLTLLPLGLTAPFGTTILGGIAISQIKHSQGRLYGLGLAAVDALLFPLLALNGLLFGGWSWFADHVSGAGLHLGRTSFVILILGLMVASCLAASWLIIRVVWRAVNKPPDGGQAGSLSCAAGASATRSGSAWKTAAIVVAAVMLILAIPVGAILLVIIPRYMSREAARVAAYDSSRVAAVEQKLTREAGERLRAANYAFDHLFVNVRNAQYDLVQCEIKGLRKPAGEGLRNGSPVQLFDALSGGLEFGHTGNGLWTVQGNGGLTGVGFTVDTSVEMGAKQLQQTTHPGAFQYPEPEEGTSAIRPAATKVEQAGPLPFAQALPGEFKVALSNGVQFEVVALASSPRSSTVWWQPDGTLLAQPPGNKLGAFSTLCPSGTAKAEFALVPKGAEGLITAGNLVLAFEPQPQYVAAGDLYKDTRLTSKVTVAGFGAAPANLTCKIGLADGAWERVATWDQAGTLLNNESGVQLDFHRSGADDETCLRLVHKVDLNRIGLRLTARLKNGTYKNAQNCRVNYGGSGSHSAVTYALIRGLQDSEVVAFELYRVPLRWACIPGLATKPNVPPIQGNVAVSGLSGRASQLDALSEADRARAVALFNDIEDFGHEFEAAFTAKNLAAAQTGTRRLLTLLTNFNGAVKGTGFEFPPGIFDDIARVRQALDEGDWDKVKQAARFNEEYAREFKRIGSRMVELARQQKQGDAGSFGSVVEKLIAGDGDANKRFIDLDTGKQLAAAEYFGPKAEPSPEETRKWWADHGIDAMGDTGSAHRGLVGFDMVAVPVSEAEWSGASPDRLKYWLTGTRPGTPAAMSAAGKLPVTYVFQTREGGRGLLQITGYADSPPGLKVRYKMVMPAVPGGKPSEAKQAP